MPRRKPDPLLREQLDERLRSTAYPPMPGYGWIRATREALGISRPQLARKLKMTSVGLAELEDSERRGTISVASLKKVAQALGCEFRYLMHPTSGSYADYLSRQAEKVARKIVERTELHMNLEAQGNKTSFIERRIKELAEDMIRRGDKKIWDEL